MLPFSRVIFYVLLTVMFFSIYRKKTLLNQLFVYKLFLHCIWHGKVNTTLILTVYQYFENITSRVLWKFYTWLHPILVNGNTSIISVLFTKIEPQNTFIFPLCFLNIRVSFSKLVVLLRIISVYIHFLWSLMEPQDVVKWVPLVAFTKKFWMQRTITNLPSL